MRGKNKLKKILSLSSDEKIERYGYQNIIGNIESKESFERMEKLGQLP